jgi:hypothetical protein
VLLAPRYEAEPPRIGLDGNDSFIPPALGLGYPSEARRGDVEAGLVPAIGSSTWPIFEELIRQKIFEEMDGAPMPVSCRTMRTRCVYDPVLAIGLFGRRSHDRATPLFAAASAAS